MENPMFDSLKARFPEVARAAAEPADDNPDCEPWCHGRGVRVVDYSYRELGRPPLTELERLGMRREFCGCAEGLLAQEVHAEAIQLELLAEEKRRLDAANIPPKLRRIMLGTLGHNGLMTEGLRWLDEGEWMLVEGAPGTGKTVYAAAILRGALARGKRGLFVRSFDFLRMMRPSSDTNPDAVTMRGDVFAVEMLVLDDLGAEGDPSSWALEQFHNLIDTRDLMELATIITTNLTPDQLMERYGVPLMDRIRGNLGRDQEWRVSLDGASRRGE